MGMSEELLIKELPGLPTGAKAPSLDDLNQVRHLVASHVDFVIERSKDEKVAAIVASDAWLDHLAHEVGSDVETDEIISSWGFLGANVAVFALSMWAGLNHLQISDASIGWHEWLGTGIFMGSAQIAVLLLWFMLRDAARGTVLNLLRPNLWRRSPDRVWRDGAARMLVLGRRHVFFQGLHDVERHSIERIGILKRSGHHREVETIEMIDDQGVPMLIMDGVERRAADAFVDALVALRQKPMTLTDRRSEKVYCVLSKCYGAEFRNAVVVSRSGIREEATNA